MNHSFILEVFNMEDIMLQLIQDFTELANDHAVTASNEHLWALGSDDESATQHEEYAEQHRAIAEMYRKMSYNVSTIIEQFMEG
jgi:N-dimethylarginine dimethylaminohydrolase